MIIWEILTDSNNLAYYRYMGNTDNRRDHIFITPI